MTANFGRYARFILRRERITGAARLAAVAFFAALLAAVYPGLFPDEASMLGLTATMNTPAMTAMMGPVYGLDALSPALVMAQECLIWFALAVIIMNIFFVNRCTRADEELGRFEMLAALPVGRLTNSAAGIALALVMNLTVSVFIAVFTLVIPIDGATAAGAFAYGLSVGAQGFVFAAVTLLTAQLFSTARGSMGAAFAVMGISYALRAQGDMSGSVLSVISPMGLGLKAEAFYTNDFMPIIVLFAEAAVIAAIALLVNAKRDIGKGVFPARKGSANASRFLRSPLGLAWRLTRNSFLAWAAGIFAISAMYGAVIGELESFVSGNEMISQMLGGAGSLADAFVAMLNSIMALIISVPVVNCVNRLRREEKRGRIESVLAAAVPRGVLLRSFVWIAVMEAAVLTLLGVFGLYMAAQGTGLVSLDMLLKAAVVYLPALAGMLGLAALLVGCAPKLTSLVWAVFGYSFLMFYFGRISDIPEWALRLSPFGNIPQVPIQDISALPLMILCGIAVLLCFAGLIGYGRRDVKG